MSVVLKQLENARKMDLDKLAIEAISQHKSEIVDLNRDQMRKGEDGKGKTRGYRSAAYLNYKQSLPTYFAGGKTDFYDRGDFQKSMFMNINGKHAEISATDWKTEGLLEKYGEQIFELNNDFKPQAHELTTPTFYKLAHDFLQS